MNARQTTFPWYELTFTRVPSGSAIGISVALRGRSAAAPSTQAARGNKRRFISTEFQYKLAASAIVPLAEARGAAAISEPRSSRGFCEGGSAAMLQQIRRHQVSSAKVRPHRGFTTGIAGQTHECAVVCGA